MALWNQATQDSDEKSPPTPILAPAPTPVVAPMAPVKESAVKERRESVFGAGVTIEGKIEGDGDIRIAGKFDGDLQIKGDVIIEKGAKVNAKVSAANLTVGGELNGNVTAAAQVKLLESAQLTGDLKAATLTVAAGSRMRGHVEFGWSASEAAKFINEPARDKQKSDFAEL
ncbi:MAG: polymer-forming cytoskeletal protein [Deltaproteobacteria bacterium]|nr:polymer-forming cytoskeletal protein [Deltaproteobacteria bacterium]